MLASEKHLIPFRLGEQDIIDLKSKIKLHELKFPTIKINFQTVMEALVLMYLKNDIYILKDVAETIKSRYPERKRKKKEKNESVIKNPRQSEQLNSPMK